MQIFYKLTSFQQLKIFIMTIELFTTSCAGAAAAHACFATVIYFLQCPICNKNVRFQTLLRDFVQLYVFSTLLL